MTSKLSSGSPPWNNTLTFLPVFRCKLSISSTARRAVGNGLAECRAQGRGDVAGKFDGDTLRVNELPQAVEIHSGVSGDLADGWQRCAFGLSFRPHIYAAESQQRGLICFVFVCSGFRVLLLAAFADHWGKNDNALFATFHPAAKLVPSEHPGDSGGVGLLPRY